MARLRFAFICNNRKDEEGLRQVFLGMNDVEDIAFFGNANDLLCHLRETPTNAVLMDMLLPNMDALQIIDDIWQLPNEIQPYIFLMSPLANEQLLNTIRDKAVYCFLKPISYEVIYIRMMQMLSSFRMSRISQPTVIERMDQCIARTVRFLGIPVHLKGYNYLRDAIKIFVLSENPMDIRITTDVYPAVAKLYGTDPLPVEHAMRSAIETAWTRGNIEAINEFFGYTVNDHKGKPSNLEFCAMIADHVRRQYRILK